MLDVNSLPEPQFVSIDWVKQVKELIDIYEQSAGITLSKGQIERLLLDIFAYRENILRILIQETAKQNLLAYARGEILDHLGALLDVERLSATPAITTLRFSFSEALPSELLIPAGTRVQSKDNKVIFVTKEDANASAGSTYIDVAAECTEAGEVGNSYTAGEINQLVDPLPYVQNVENITMTYGGNNTESDDHLRERIQLAPEIFSNAGSRGAYEYWAKTAHQDIVDAAVWSPEPGTVKVVPLLKNGEIPDQDMLDLVAKTLNDEKVRPLTDQVIVEVPEEVSYSIDVSLYIYKSASALSDVIQQQAEETLIQYTQTHSEKLGLDIVPEQIIGSLQKIVGVYRVVVNQPGYIEVAQNQVAKCSGISIVIAGSVDG